MILVIREWRETIGRVREKYVGYLYMRSIFGILKPCGLGSLLSLFSSLQRLHGLSLEFAA
jgi:hypothetical protein